MSKTVDPPRHRSKAVTLFLHRHSAKTLGVWEIVRATFGPNGECDVVVLETSHDIKGSFARMKELEREYLNVN